MASHVSIPKGTRDFTPDIMAKRNYIFETIKNIFCCYGFLPIETPAMENLSTLLGKYGDEGDKLLFKVLNSGDFLQKVDSDTLAKGDSSKASLQLSEKGLRYDLTVPFARYVIQHLNDITMPFKRYQIQPVWRADRPQKGRYREFYQCDADVIGSESLINEAELVAMASDVYTALGINTCAKINNRKILAGMGEYIGQPDHLTDITVAIDKMDKIGLEKVMEEMRAKDISFEAVEKLVPFLTFSGSDEEKIIFLQKMLLNSEVGCKGIEEVKILWQYLKELDLTIDYELDLTLARGLNYYTGAIFEMKALDASIGSIGGGGRYDDLTGVFGKQGLSGVGLSFGADRIYDVMEQLHLFPERPMKEVELMFVNFGQKEAIYCLKLIQSLRKQGTQCELYPDAVKMKKQMAYANKRGIPFVAVIGNEEMMSDMLTLKNMQTGEQQIVKANRDSILQVIPNGQ